MEGMSRGPSTGAGGDKGKGKRGRGSSSEDTRRDADNAKKRRDSSSESERSSSRESSERHAPDIIRQGNARRRQEITNTANLTREANDLQNGADNLHDESVNLEGRRTELKRPLLDLFAKYPDLDQKSFSDPAARDFETARQSFNRDVDNFNNKMTHFEGNVDDFNGRVAGYNEVMPFDEEDLPAISRMSHLHSLADMQVQREEGMRRIQEGSSGH